MGTSKKAIKLLKGSLKDPFLHLGIILVILFGTSYCISHFMNVQSNSIFPNSLSIQLSKIKEEPFAGVMKSCLESPELSLIEGSSLKAFSPPVTVTPQVLGQLTGGAESETGREIIEYIVQSGDNLWSIASEYEISLDTLLWANDLNKSSILKPGQKLIILPVSGVIHHVKSGDTISEIAKTYKGKVEEITVFNDLSQEGDIFIGDILLIPDGVMPPPQIYVPSLVPLASSYFICPISSPCRITQGLHWYNAVDFSHGRCGEPIFAAAGGEVLKIRYGWNNGAGNYLTVLHPNGVVTFYGHVSKILVSSGDPVSQGQIIALMGGQPGTPGAGKSTGCHLHFGVSGARNPFR